MASDIGIKIANGEFYPILKENSLIRKRLILTTVHDKQQSVQIDLYRSSTDTITDAQYIGSLVVENIRPKPKGEPSIEMIISSKTNGDIIANAIDLDTSAGGEHYELVVSLKSLDETSRDMEFPDFELESNEEPPSGLYHHAKRIQEKKKRRSFGEIIFLIGWILILCLLAAWLLFFGGREVIKNRINRLSSLRTSQAAPASPAVQATPAEQVTPAETQPEPEPVRQAEPVLQAAAEPAEPVPVIQAPATPPAPRPRTASGRPPPPVASYAIPEIIPREGVDYPVRYGDTLWDIADAFYRDPWLYPRIARQNNISNPNHIISGRTIRVPPKN